MSEGSKHAGDDTADRSKRVETDVTVYRLRIGTTADGGVVFGWDYPGSTLLRVRIFRAEVATGGGGAVRPGSALAAKPEPEPPPDGPWAVVYDGDTGSFRDAGVASDRAYRYAVYARHGDGPWTLWRVHEVRPT